MLATLEEAPVTAVISGEELDTIIREAYVLGNRVRRGIRGQGESGDSH